MPAEDKPTARQIKTEKPIDKALRKYLLSLKGFSETAWEPTEVHSG